MKIAIIVAVALGAVLAVGLAILATVDIPAPSSQVEKTIPADRLPH
jgi:hypothetical protein